MAFFFPCHIEAVLLEPRLCFLCCQALHIYFLIGSTFAHKFVHYLLRGEKPVELPSFEGAMKRESCPFRGRAVQR